MGMPPFPQPVRGRNLSAATKNDRGDAIFLEANIEAWQKAGGLEWVLLGKSTGATRNEGDYLMSDVNEAYEKANLVISNANTAYNKTVVDFRSTIKNDMTSISASADKVQKESVKLSAAYRASISLLNSPEMITAIANAERLAAALTAISQVQPNKIAFAVIETQREG
jgi:hypothetical protein